MKKFQRVYIEITDYCGLSCAFCPNSNRFFQESESIDINSKKTAFLAQRSVFKPKMPSLITPTPSTPNNIALNLATLSPASSNLNINTISSYRGIMPLDMFESICAQISNKARRVCLHLLGDPLSVRNLDKYVAILDRYKLQIDLVTTGLFLCKSHFDMLTSPPFVQVSFSLSAFFTNQSRLHKTHLIRILEFCRYKIDKDSPTFINLRLHSNDISQKSSYFKDMLGEIALFFGIKSHEIECMISNGKVRLANKVLLVPKQSFEWELNTSREQKASRKQHRNIKTTRFCHGAHEQIGILSNGDVVPCCIDYASKASFGCIRDKSLDEILESNEFIEFKNKLELGIPASKLCENCGYAKQ